MKKIFVICPVRDASSGVTQKIKVYIKQKEKEGYRIHWPPVHTDQNDPRGTRICRNNLTAIYEADEVHIWYDKTSTGSHFDLGGLGMLLLVLEEKFSITKKVVLINKDCPDIKEKSFLKVIKDLEAGDY